MAHTLAPLRFDPTYETVDADEEETQRGLTEAMLSIQRKTHADTGHAYRSVHAKAHGYLRARFEVLPNLSSQLAQGAVRCAGRLRRDPPVQYDAG